MTALVLSLVFGCILDRTGQSGTARLQAEIRDHGVRVTNLEQQFVQVEARVHQIENLTRSRGQQDILRMETLDELRREVARIRGEVEVLSHATGQGAKDLTGRVEDAAFRVLWLESRADQLERSLGLNTPAPPALPEPVDEQAPKSSNWEAGSAEVEAAESSDAVAEATPAPAPEPEVPDPVSEPALKPKELLSNAKAQLKADNPKGAETMLNRFLELYPNDALADEATYRRAEAAMNAEDYQNAVLRFQEVIDQFKASPFAPWAMLRQGECFEKQGQNENAQVFFAEVIRIWPKSRAAKSAKAKKGK